jgi:hypothetical protein
LSPERRENVMKRNLLIVALVPLALVTGCATIDGKWSLAKVDPTAARSDFAFKSLTLQNDGTFYGETEDMGGARAVSGTWRLRKGVLSLKERDGEQHTYDAELLAGGRRLELVRHWEGQRMTAVLEKRTP